MTGGEASSGSHSTPHEVEDKGGSSESSSNESDAANSRNQFNAYSICALAITTVIGGQYYEWNTYLEDGFGFFITAQMLMAFAYIVYVFTMAEIVSAFPFSGGGFGLARVAQGYYVGFLIGCTEALEYIAYSALSFLYLSEQICLLTNIDKYYSFLFSFVLYVVAGAITIHKGQFYLQLNYFLAGISIIILLIYCFGTLKWDNFMENASLSKHDDNANVYNWFDGGMKAFLMALPSATVAYGGIEGMCLLPTLTSEPKKNIPRGMIGAVLILLACNVLVIFVFASQPGGIEVTSKEDYPMTVGFSLMFDMPPVYGKLLMLPAQFAEGFGFILCYGKLLQALGTTNILPSVLRLKNCTDHTMGVIVGSIIGFIICVIYRVAGQELMDICILAGFITYLSQLHGYWMLKTRYSNAVREFTSPFGLVGVAYCVVIFLLGVVSIVGFERDHSTVIIVGSTLAVLSVYYFMFGAKHQTMAQEEMAVLFQLHVAKFNKRKKVKPSKKIASRPNMIVPIIRKLSEQKCDHVSSSSNNVNESTNHEYTTLFESAVQLSVHDSSNKIANAGEFQMKIAKSVATIPEDGEVVDAQLCGSGFNKYLLLDARLESVSDRASERVSDKSAEANAVVNGTSNNSQQEMGLGVVSNSDNERQQQQLLPVAGIETPLTSVESSLG